MSEDRPASESWDEAAWRALAAELDAWGADGRRATLFWRDDDAGRPHPGLPRLLALAAATVVPLGLAVVPAWLTAEVAATLCAAPRSLAVLQHGFAHANHEATPGRGERKVRPAECGAARPAAAVLAEAADGQARLRAIVGDRLAPVFVPPWNRIAPEVLVGLPRAGYRAVSAFGPRSGPEATPGLLQLNCHVDPIVWREGKRFGGAGAALGRLRSHLADRRAGRADPGEPTGLLTHHRDMSAAFWAFLGELLGRLGAHPAAAFPPIAALLGPPR